MDDIKFNNLDKLVSFFIGIVLVILFKVFFEQPCVVIKN